MLHPLKVKLRPHFVSNAFKNKISAILRVTGIATYISGFFLGISTAYTDLGYYGHIFSWFTALFTWCCAFISGTMLFGFSEIITLLDANANKSYESEDISQQLNVVIKEALAEIIINPPIIQQSYKEILFEYRPDKWIVCPKCGKKQSSDANTCESCNVKFIYKTEDVVNLSNNKE